MSKKLSSIWISFIDENGSEALEALQIRQDLNNPVGAITVKSLSFYVKDEKGISTRVKTIVDVDSIMKYNGQ